jgi:hypothetical protein
MATTTNYSWSTPDDTALVKDGAAAIRSLGTAIDTTVFTNAGAAINKTIIDAKGDLIVGTAADTAARLAVGGTNGHVLQVDSTAGSGIKWGALAAGAYTLLSTTTLSGSSTSITGIDQTYQDLFVEVFGITFSTSNRTPSFGLNSGGSFNIVQLGTVFGTGTGTTIGFNDQAEDFLRTSADNTFTVLINNYKSTTAYKSISGYCGYRGQSSNLTRSVILGSYVSTSAVSSVQIALDGGRTFSTGTVNIYGVK